MKLSSAIRNLTYTVLQGRIQDEEITSIAFDSRNVQDESIFVAITGFSKDGHLFINQAIHNGASVIITEKDISVPKHIIVLKVKNSRNALALIASNFYNLPTEKLHLIGITGTNGKTSTSYFLKSIYEAANKSIGIIGTIGTIIHDKLISNDNTTPESLVLQQLFARMVHEDISSCMMEVSSHALDMERVAYSRFNIGIYTNLSPDHLELHKNMDEYFRAKAKLFHMTSDYNIINIDDAYGKKLAEISEHERARTITYGIHHKADVYPSDLDYSLHGTTYKVHIKNDSETIHVHLPGEIYVYNSLAAIASAYASGIPLPVVKEGIDNVHGIKGRFEVVHEEDDFRVIIDFAHTEDALKQTLMTVRPYVKGAIILVFGVYADISEQGEDKRHGMGKVAAEYADYSIVTLDNPKTYDKEKMLKGVTDAIGENDGSFETITDRETAIQRAVKISRPIDTVVIAGKGHETTQIIGQEEIPINEKEIVREALIL